MTEEIWMNQILDELTFTADSYEERALLFAIKKILTEQKEQIEQLEGQLDGQLWNHKE